MRKVSISSRDGKTEITLDGISISKRCLGFRLEQSGGELPILHIDLMCDEVDICAGAVKTEKKTAPAVTSAVVGLRCELGKE